MVHLITLIFALLTLNTTAFAQAQARTVAIERVALGNGFTVAKPAGDDWQQTGSPATFIKQIKPETHTLVLHAATEQSNLSEDELFNARKPNNTSRLITPISRLLNQTWKQHIEFMNAKNLETGTRIDDSSGNYTTGKLYCGFSRITVSDRTSQSDDNAEIMRYVAYSCLEYPDLAVATSVSYSERGQKKDLSNDAMAEGERFANSLQRVEK